MARILPTVVVLALLGCTAAAFAVTEGLKLEHSPISRTAVSKVVAPDSASDATASIQFVLRKPDRVTVQLVNGSGQVVRTLARSRRLRAGLEQFGWNGRNDSREVVPDGSYRPRVHLAGFLARGAAISEGGDVVRVDPEGQVEVGDRPG